MNTNIIAVIVSVFVTTNTVLVSLHPSGVERYTQDVIQSNHVYSINGSVYTNVVSITSNEIMREVWSRTPLIRQPLGIMDNTNQPPFPFPPGYISVEEAWRSHQTNAPDHDPMTNDFSTIMPPR